MASTGLAFSGGGIRSAAFCSGVLRRLLECGVEVDYLSCVSGGGYTGTAYLDWKYREEKKARMGGKEGEHQRNWHEDFFNHMTQRAGYICNWKKPLQGILDTIVLSCLVVSVIVIQPLIKWGCYAWPVAFLIDYLFGWLMRNAADCDALLADVNSDSESLNKTIQLCSKPGSDTLHTVILFIGLLALFSTSYLLLRLLKRPSQLLNIFLQLGKYTSGSFLVFTFIPFTIYDFFVKIPLWTQLFLGIVAVLLWIVVPLLRSKTSYVLIIYCYSYIVYWKVYEGDSKLFGLIEYSKNTFQILLLASGFTLWVVPLVITFQERLVHVYNRWRLQKAFFHSDGLGRCGCSGISLQHICPLWTCLLPNKQENGVESRPLTLADLKGMTPEFLSNIVVNSWKLNHEAKETYELLVMSPTRIERFDRDPNKSQFEGRLDPEDVMLSDATATSAAALSTHMGRYDRSIGGLTRLHTILGLEMGAIMVTDAKSLKDEHLALKIAPYLVHLFRGLPLIAVPTFYIYDGSETTTFDESVTVAIICFFIIHIVLAFIALIDTGAQKSRWYEKLARWFTVHNSFVYYVREFFSKNNIGPLPPPILLLSDGGHVENLALLPLLKKRLQRIVVVDGCYKNEKKFYGESILNAMQLARKKLNCAFLSEDGHDVTSDFLAKFVNPETGRNLCYYKFKVYYREDEFGPEGEGEILLIVPNNSQRDASVRADEATAHDDEPSDKLEELYHDDVGELTLCCCECCHQKSCQWLSETLCNIFPQHYTVNQFFTPRMFAAYHGEGYRVCAEATADIFLMDLTAERCTRETSV